MTVAAVVSTPWESKFKPLRPLIADLVRHGFEVHVLTDRRFEDDVRRAGGRFVDLFGTYSLEAVDDESIPLPSRQVTFAAAYADQVAADLARLDPAVIVYDSFAVIAGVLGRMLGIPYVAYCAGHNVDPSKFVAQTAADDRVSTSAACSGAVTTLRERYGLDDASPFSYLSNLSPFLNLYGEPPEFLTPQERRIFEPVAFYGSLPSREEIEMRRAGAGTSWPPPEDSMLKVYVAFGAYVWTYWPGVVLDALACISDVLGELPGVSALISLGGAELGPNAAMALSKPNVAVAPFVEQWEALAQADLFVTHQGELSTHEAIFSCVPMLSYPFFHDQPGLAAKCAQLGLAIPLADWPRQPLTPDRVHATLAEITNNGDSIRSRLVQAREWELRLLAERDAVIRQIEALV
jgi:UDP:flavonoid glycosyltransferase YjiC (YdhE family)